MRKSILTLIALLSLALSPDADGAVIRIRSQYEFDQVQSKVSAALKGGDTDITVRFEPGIYYFREKHFSFIGWQFPKASIVYDGQGAVLSGAGYDISATRKKKGRYTATWLGYDRTQAVVDLGNQADVRPFGPMRQAKGKIEILDAASGLCRFKADEPAASRSARMSVQFTSWYLGFLFPVVKIEGGYIYFQASKLTKSGGFYNIEGDRNYGGVNPKYQLINAPDADLLWSGNRYRFLKKGVYHICEASQAVALGSCSLKSVTFQNFTFLGNSETAEILMHSYQTQTKFTVRQCTFRGIRNLIVSCQTSGALFADNKVEGCYRGFLRVDPACDGTQILRNKFKDNQLYINNTMEVICRGKNFLVKDNVFEDFTYCAIALGNHFLATGNVASSGVVEGNEIYYTEAYRKEPSRTLMDSGAIYCWTLQDNVIIRDNYIHDYTGTKDNRGIFGDDGTCNTTVTGNKIVRIGNSYCIDFRRVESVEKTAGSAVKKSNMGIKMYDNSIDGKVRFEPRSGDKTSRKGTNKQLK